MNVYGIAVPVELEVAVEEWMKSHKKPNGFRSSDLVAFITTKKVPYLSPGNAAERFIQKHKNKKQIQLCGANNWCWRDPVSN